MKYCIIGSGLAGLTVGAYLAQAGHEVYIFEQYPQIGGVTATVRQAGFAWDIGPLLLGGFGPRGRARQVLQELGILDKIGLIRSDRGLVTPDFAFWPPLAGKQLDKAVPPPDFYWRKHKLTQLFPSEAKALDRYYKIYIRILKLVYLSGVIPGMHGLKKTWMQLKLFFITLPIFPLMKLNANEFLDRLFAENKIKGLLSGILADFVVPPSQYPGLGIPLVNEETAFDRRIPLEPEPYAHQHAFHYIEGGCESMVEALADKIRSHGGKIITSCPVKQIRVDGSGKAVGVEFASGEFQEADGVVSAITALPTFTQLLKPESLDPLFLQQAHKVPLMESVFMVHLGIDFDPSKYQPTELAYYYRTYDIEGAVRRITEGNYHEGEDGLLIYVPSLHSPSMSPPGQHAVTIYTVAPNVIGVGDKSYHHDREYFADKLVEIAEEYIPGLAAHTVTRLIMTPEDFRQRLAVGHHSFGGSAPVIGGKNVPYITPVHGLWFAGCQSESTGGIENVLYGAREVSKLILQPKGAAEM